MVGSEKPFSVMVKSMKVAIQCSHIQCWSESINIIPQRERESEREGEGERERDWCLDATPLHAGDKMTHKTRIGHG